MNVKFFIKSTPLHDQRQILKKFCNSINGGNINAVVEVADVYKDCDVAVIFGSWKKSPKKKWKQMLKHHFLKREVIDSHRGKLIVIETPLLGRTISENGLHSHYRVGLNHFMRGLADFKNTNSKPDRFEKLNIPIKPWRKSGDHILIVGQNLHDASLFGIDFVVILMSSEYPPQKGCKLVSTLPLQNGNPNLFMTNFDNSNCSSSSRQESNST